jgi:DNA replication protein DnaC
MLPGFFQEALEKEEEQKILKRVEEGQNTLSKNESKRKFQKDEEGDDDEPTKKKRRLAKVVVVVEEERDDFGEDVPSKELSKSQRLALQSILSGQNVLLTGGAGTGKTTLVRLASNLLQKKYKGQHVFVVAQTETAAQMCGGKTLHSLMGLGLAKDNFKESWRQTLENERLVDQWERTAVLLIDSGESMNTELFEKLSYILRQIHGSGKPFGGIQVVLAADFVGGLDQCSRSDYSKYEKYLFQSPVFQKMHFEAFLFETNYRTKDPQFASLLERLRVGKTTSHDYAWLKSRIVVCPPKIRLPVEITTKRAVAKKANEQLKTEMSHLPHVEYFGVYQPESSPGGLPVDINAFRRDDDVLKLFPGQHKLKLHQATHVVALVGLETRDIHTGKKCFIEPGCIGIVIGFTDNADKQAIPVVEFFLESTATAFEPKAVEDSGGSQTVAIPFFVFRRYSPKYGYVLGKRLPLDLGFSIDVRSVAGRTLHAARMDLVNLSKIPGGVYTALSRVTDPVNHLYIQRVPDCFPPVAAERLLFHSLFSNPANFGAKEEKKKKDKNEEEPTSFDSNVMRVEPKAVDSNVMRVEPKAVDSNAMRDEPKAVEEWNLALSVGSFEQSFDDLFKQQLFSSSSSNSSEKEESKKKPKKQYKKKKKQGKQQTGVTTLDALQKEEEEDFNEREKRKQLAHEKRLFKKSLELSAKKKQLQELQSNLSLDDCSSL